MNYNLRTWFFRDQPVIGASEASNSPWALVSSLLDDIFLLAAIILFILIVGAGFMLVSSSSNPDRAEQGKQVATFAIIGFIIIFVSYWVIQIVETITGVQILG